MQKTRSLAILLFDEVEVLDFCGPFEVFSITGRNEDPRPFRVFTVAESATIRARNGLSVNPDYSLEACPDPDILVVPGGMGTREQIQNERLITWIKEKAPECELVLSVCTGALLLGQAALLENLEATTHHGAFDLLRRVAPNASVLEGRRYVDTGRIVTSAGIAAGIDMSLHVVGRLLGSGAAAATARHMEYPLGN